MRKFLIAATILVALAASASAKIYFEDTFAAGDLDGWVISNWKKNEGSAGKFEVSAGKFYNDAEADKGSFAGRRARRMRFFSW
jgi:calreticulin